MPSVTCSLPKAEFQVPAPKLLGPNISIPSIYETPSSACRISIGQVNQDISVLNSSSLYLDDNYQSLLRNQSTPLSHANPMTSQPTSKSNKQMSHIKIQEAF